MYLHVEQIKTADLNSCQLLRIINVLTGQEHCINQSAYSITHVNYYWLVFQSMIIVCVRLFTPAEGFVKVRHTLSWGAAKENRQVLFTLQSSRVKMSVSLKYVWSLSGEKTHNWAHGWSKRWSTPPVSHWTSRIRWKIHEEEFSLTLRRWISDVSWVETFLQPNIQQRSNAKEECFSVLKSRLWCL